MYAEQKRLTSLIRLVSYVLVLLPRARREAPEDVVGSCDGKQYRIFLPAAGFMEGCCFEPVLRGSIGKGDIGNRLTSTFGDVAEKERGEFIRLFGVFEG